MDAKQNIYYALGILSYAIAKSDGEVQEAERQMLTDIVKREIDHNIDFQYAEIIFRLLERDHTGMEGTYKWAIKELEKGRHYLSPEIKKKMVEVIRLIAQAFNSVSAEEASIIKRFQADLENIGVDHYLK